MKTFLLHGSIQVCIEKEYTIVDEDVIVELAVRQVGIDVEQYPYKDVKVGQNRGGSGILI